MPYWHVQELLVSELALGLARGLTSNLGLELRVPLRVVRDRVRYLDLTRQPYAPPNPDLHHRNETLAGFGDPQLAANVGRRLGAWTLVGSAGVSIPVGRTEPNPFELGRAGLWHQHIQFGSGSWDPLLGLGVGTASGRVALDVSATARLALGGNPHGYRAGDRYTVQLRGTPDLGGGWMASAGLLLAREETETWSGSVEDEGNLGRTDLLLCLGGGRAVAPIGALHLELKLPLASESTGDQVDIPIIFTLAWGR